MKLDLEFVELHSPLFIDGMNFGLKLYSDPKRSKAPITMWYDTDLRHTIVLFKEKVSLIENTASMTLAKPEQIGLKVTPNIVIDHGIPMEPRKGGVVAQVSGPGMGLKMNAQVETPMDKVQGGIKKRPKYQGEESQGE